LRKTKKNYNFSHTAWIVILQGLYRNPQLFRRFIWLVGGDSQHTSSEGGCSMFLLSIDTYRKCVWGGRHRVLLKGTGGQRGQSHCKRAAWRLEVYDVKAILTRCNKILSLFLSVKIPLPACTCYPANLLASSLQCVGTLRHRRQTLVQRVGGKQIGDNKLTALP
jgi:hypothetical protein